MVQEIYNYFLKKGKIWKIPGHYQTISYLNPIRRQEISFFIFFFFFRNDLSFSLFLGDWCFVSARGFCLNKQRVWLGPNVWKNSVRISNVSILMPRQVAASISVPQYMLLYFSLFHFLLFTCTHSHSGCKIHDIYRSVHLPRPNWPTNFSKKYKSN